jgi:hypothetical protein
MLKAQITYFGKQVTVACDGCCHKAWGISSRPGDLQDGNKLICRNDDELDEAPADPGTYEGGYGKPRSNQEFPNKWCVRQCERSVIAEDPEQIVLPRFDLPPEDRPFCLVELG